MAKVIAMEIRKAISVRQPWAWLIVNGWKDVENRTWRTDFRGRVLIHAAKGMTQKEYDACHLFVASFAPSLAYQLLPDPDDFDRGGIVGEVEIVDCMSAHTSKWFCGPYGFVLDKAKELPFRPCKGSLGFFNTPWEAAHV